jgi:hypothetical protein
MFLIALCLLLHSDEQQPVTRPLDFQMMLSIEDRQEVREMLKRGYMVRALLEVHI